MLLIIENHLPKSLDKNGALSMENQVTQLTHVIGNMEFLLIFIVLPTLMLTMLMQTILNNLALMYPVLLILNLHHSSQLSNTKP